MAINLNDSLYGAQFNAFRNLANDASLSQDTLVSVDEAGRGKGLLNQNGEKRTIVVKQGDTIRPLFGRSQGHVDLNNEVRNLFRETVLRICDAKTLDDLPKAVQDVMKKKDYDDEGHPLSLRRIRLVTNAILAEAKAGESQAEDPDNTIGDVPTNDVTKIDDGQAKEPSEIDSEDEVESSVDDDEVSFEYDTPDYVAGLPRETEVAFMDFYCDAVKTTVKDGRTKEDCDNTLRDMFKAIGYDKNDRKLLAELLAGGKPRFLDENGRLPFDFEASRFAKDFKSVLDLTKHYRAKLPKAYGDIVADTILAVLKTGGRMFDADELKPIDADLCEEIAATAKKIDAGKLLAPPSGKSRSAKSLAKALDAFRREAAGKFAAELLRPNDSDLMTKIKQSILMSLAIAQGDAAAESLAEEIEEHGDELAAKYGMQDLLADIAPGLGINANASSAAES